MALTNDYPTIRPSLLLDFARSRALDPRITFTRATIATRVNEDGLVETVGSGVPRFDFDPVTLTSKGLLIEEQRTNLLTYSEDFGNAAWNKGNSTVSTNTVTAPDGATTADSLVDDATNGGHFITSVAVTNSATTTYVASVFAKANTLPILSLWIRNSDSSANYAWWQFDLSTGTAVVSGGGVVGTGYSNASASISSYGNGWYRCFLTATVDVAVTGVRVWIREQKTVGGTNYIGTGESLYIWGAQLEAGAFPTSYIPTTTASVQRNADLALMSGSNLTSWFNAGEGTIFVKASRYAAGGTNLQYIMCEFGNTASNNDDLIQLGSQYNANNTQFLINAGGINQVAIVEVGTTALTNYIAAYKVNDFAYTKNGVTVSTDTSGILPYTLTQFNIGSRPAFSNVGYLNGCLSKIAYYPVRLTNAQLQALTRS